MLQHPLPLQCSMPRASPLHVHEILRGTQRILTPPMFLHRQIGRCPCSLRRRPGLRTGGVVSIIIHRFVNTSDPRARCFVRRRAVPPAAVPWASSLPPYCLVPSSGWSARPARYFGRFGRFGRKPSRASPSGDRAPVLPRWCPYPGCFRHPRAAATTSDHHGRRCGCCSRARTGRATLRARRRESPASRRRRRRRCIQC